MSENITPERREVIVSGDENCFYRAVALWKNEISDEKRKEIPRSSDNLSRNIQRFLSSQFLLELFGGSCREQQDHGNSGRKFGHIFRCVSLLKRPICTKEEA